MKHELAFARMDTQDGYRLRLRNDTGLFKLDVAVNSAKCELSIMAANYFRSVGNDKQAEHYEDIAAGSLRNGQVWC
jgi:hypothetical protein